MLFGLLIFMIGIINHYYFKTATHDYANYNFAFWDYSHFRISSLTTFKGNFLQDHFSFTLMFFTPIFWLLNWLTGSYTLIIIQCSLILLAAWYSHKIILLKTNNRWLSTGVLLYYFLLLGRYTSFAADVNLAILSACFIPIFLYYFQVKKYGIAAIILILSLFSRENIPLWFIFIFIVLIIENRRDKKSVWFCLLGIAVSIIYFVLLFKVFIPATQSPDAQYALFNYAALGAGPKEAFLFMLSNPIETIKLFFENHLNTPGYNGIKKEFYLVYLISGGILLILKPQLLIWFFPIVAQKVLNDAPVRWGIISYYAVEVITLLPLSVFLALSSLKWKNAQVALCILACVGATTMTIHKMDINHCVAPWMMNPKKEKFYDKRFWEKPFDIKKVNKLLSLIPSEAKVSSSNMFTPHLAHRQYIYFFPNVKDADYIVFSVFDDNYLYPQMINERCRIDYLESPKWEIIAAEYPVFLLKRRNEESAQLNAPLNSIWSHTETQKFSFGDANSSYGNDQDSTIKPSVSVSESIQLKNDNENIAISLHGENSYSPFISIKDLEKINHLRIEVWQETQKKGAAFIVADNSNGFYRSSNVCDSIDSQGRERLVLSFWIPQNIGSDELKIALKNTTNELIHFGDITITKGYKRNN